MQIDKESGLLVDVPYHCSPNHDARPDEYDIAGIVIHNISLPPGEFGGGWIDDLFLNQLDPADTLILPLLVSWRCPAMF